MNKRTKFIEQLSAQMIEWDAQIESLMNMASNLEARGAFEQSLAIAVLQFKRNQAV
jgi:hypothetical protein